MTNRTCPVKNVPHMGINPHKSDISGVLNRGKTGHNGHIPPYTTFLTNRTYGVKGVYPPYQIGHITIFPTVIYVTGRLNVDKSDMPVWPPYMWTNRHTSVQIRTGWSKSDISDISPYWGEEKSGII